MANRNFDQGWCLGKRIVEIAGSFGTNGASNPAAASIRGLGFSKTPITHSGTGQYTVTLDDPFLDLNSFGADLQVAAAGANWAQVGPVAGLGTAAGPTITLFTINGAGTAVDIAANANSRVAFSFTFRDSSVGKNLP